jgi:hypothetical protein
VPKLRKEDVADIDVDELEEAEYSEGNFVSYSGEIPPEDTVLAGVVKSMWWTRTNPKPGGNPNGDAMVKVLWVAEENDGDLEEYNGLPAWENMALTAPSKFKWGPFFDHFGISIRDVRADNKSGKNNVVVSDTDEQMGSPIEKIGPFVPGSDEAYCRIVVAREKYDGRWQAHVKAWLDWEEGDDDDDDEVDEVEPEDEEEEDTEEEEEPEEVPPPRGRRTAAKASNAPAATSTRPAARKPATARSGAAKAPAPKRGRRGAAGSSDEPPF